MKLNKDYWENRYETKATQWDIGYASTPLQTYIDQLTDKNLRILIPGAGNGYEAEYLFHKGFKNVHVVDIAINPLQNIQNRIKEFPAEQLIHTDFFALNLKFDLILEQTFFCALDPEQRKSYVRKMSELLTPHGKVAGLLFNFPLTIEGPPFGGSEKEYKTIFTPYFNIKTLNTCYNSIKQRSGNELFFIFEKNSSLQK